MSLRSLTPPDGAEASDGPADFIQPGPADIPGRTWARSRLAGGQLRAAAVRALTVLLWLLVGTSAAAGLSALVAVRGATRPAPAAAPTPEAAPQGFAELYVAAFLGEAGEGREDVLRPYFPEPVDLRGVVPGSRYVARTAAVDARQIAPGYWSVVVAADLLTATQGGYRRAGTHYYALGVSTARGGPVATSLPAEVPAPAAGEAPRPALGSLGAPAGGPAVEATERFFSAFLAGQGELARYASPESGLRPIAPPPYAAATLRRIAMSPPAGARAHLIQAEVEVADEQGRRQVLHYFLRAAEREGRWEVTELLPAAPLAAGETTTRR